MENDALERDPLVYVTFTHDSAVKVTYISSFESRENPGEPSPKYSSTSTGMQGEWVSAR
jgi:hypothetical protein